MTDSETHMDTMRALAEARVSQRLLLELTEVLLLRGVIKDGDISGALLRMEYKVRQDMELEDNADPIMTASMEFESEAMISEWEGRLVLKPSLHTLRQKQSEWMMKGMPDRSPLDAENVAALYDVVDEDD
ncbi:hypothetical protein [Martelella radicis]|uniref:Uncharacterized protein n=1 Tax=Martelella radicis TaxID=1397476 RepID=A0A7W6KKM9_9HYPH|nr:hypothetical protein [Martelella radicis]MBB4122953.1 hypothetical protein [Martelella radicis]